VSIYDKYDRPAQAYESRLQAASAAEEARNRELWARTKEDTEAQLAAETEQAYRDVGGAAVGQGQMGLGPTRPAASGGAGLPRRPGGPGGARAHDGRDGPSR
jgi:hypothetical protein